MVVQAFNGLRAAASVQQVKPGQMMYAQRSNKSQTVQALFSPGEDPILGEAMKVRLLCTFSVTSSQLFFRNLQSGHIIQETILNLSSDAFGQPIAV